MLAPAVQIHDTPKPYRLPVLRALIGIEEMRAALYDENPAGDPCAELRAIEARERIEQLRTLQGLIEQCRAVEAATLS